jgi:hypothetical protein
MLRWSLAWSLALVSAVCCFSALAQSVEVPPELWDRPRTAQAVLGQENVKRAVLLGLEKPEAQIVIHHGAGQEPLLQAEELRSWLAALAIDSRRVALRNDGAAGAPMRIEIVP